MTSTDVTRLYALISEVQREQRAGMTDLRDEVKGYRADLNGRLRALEQAEARREGVGHGRGSVGRAIWGVAAVSAAIGSIVGVIATLV
jgi:hypothetical protein